MVSPSEGSIHSRFTGRNGYGYGFMRVPQYIGGILKEAKVTEEQINMACRRVLEAKYKLGLFSNPYKYCDALRAKEKLYTPEHRSAARAIAAETFVLLKNDNNLLPLEQKAGLP